MDQRDYQNYKDYIEYIDFQRYWLVLKRRWLPASVLAVCCALGATALAMRQQSGGYRASGQVIVQRDRSIESDIAGQSLRTPEALGREANVIATQSEILSSSQLLEGVIEALDLRTPDGSEMSPSAIKSGLEVEPIPGTLILQITYESPDPERSAAVVNTLIDLYIDQSIESNRSEARATREYIEDQIPEAEQAFIQAAEALQDFKLNNDIVDLETESVAMVGLLETVEASIRDLGTQFAAADARAEAITDQLSLSAEQAQDLVRLSTAPSLRGVLDSLGEVQTELALQEAVYTGNHPTVTSLQRQQNQLTDLLNERVASIVGQPYSPNVGDYEFSPLEADLTAELLAAQAEQDAITNSIQELENARLEYASRSDVLPTLERRHLQLTTMLNAAQREYELLLSRLQEVRLVENQTLGTIQVQERAVPPASPTIDTERPLKIIVAGIGAGILSGIALAFLLDLLDKSIKTAKDAEALLGYTLLGVIPKFSVLSDSAPAEHRMARISPRIVTLTNSQPLISSSYQMLQANLKFIRSDHPLRMFAVSSSVPQEGKSEVCANLAVSMAQVGRRVLLIDADMRSPTQHHLWNVLNRVGLSHVLVGEGKLEDALQSVAENVTLLPAGVVPPNPLALVDSERMAALMQELSAQYDYVILDTPPLIGAADAAVMGKMADGVLLIVRPRQVDSSSALAAKSLLNRAGAEVLGFVANGIDLKNEHDDYVSMTRSRFDIGADEREGVLAGKTTRRNSIGIS
jgi:capsular exopolysaccharide synthesis family protein